MSAVKPKSCVGVTTLIWLMEKRRDEYEGVSKKAARDAVDALKPMQRAECMRALTKSLAARDALNGAIDQAKNILSYFEEEEWMAL